MRWLLVLVTLAACARSVEPAGDGPAPERAFYYWRTTWKLSETEQRTVGELGVKRIYVRMFDITWQDGPVEVGKLAVDGPVPAGVEIVPVVFVRDEVMKKLPAARIAELAKTTWASIAERMAQLGATPHELQLDCDWTDSTKTAYFALIRAARAESHLAMSATIRLHQIKYRERTGVPPIDRGMLMFYNMGKFSADPDARAIFDGASAEKYLARIADYPLALDVALPIWSWTLHVRDDRVIGLMQSTDPAELDELDFVDAERRVTRTTFLHGEMLREGDRLKVEVTGPDETLDAARMIAARLPPANRTVTLFDLSERNLKRHAGLDQVFVTFGHR